MALYVHKQTYYTGGMELINRDMYTYSYALTITDQVVGMSRMSPLEMVLGKKYCH